METFSKRLGAAIGRKRNPVVVGLDPRASSLPPGMLDEGTSAKETATAYQKFCYDIIDVVCDLVPVVKPQAAFFEQLGSAGFSALAEVVRYAREKGLLVVLDGKRNDIGSTATAYANAYLTNADETVASDALTVSPYLGEDSIRPFVDSASQHGTGIFVLVKTSNPGGGMFQDLVADGRRVYEYVAEYVQCLALETVSENGYGAIGAVVGATYPEQLAELRSAMPQTWILVPGFGAQGGTAKDVAHAFDAQGFGAIVNNSRGIIFAYNRPEFEAIGKSNWQNAVEAATQQMIQQLRTETNIGKL